MVVIESRVIRYYKFGGSFIFLFMMWKYISIYSWLIQLRIQTRLTIGHNYFCAFVLTKVDSPRNIAHRDDRKIFVRPKQEEYKTAAITCQTYKEFWRFCKICKHSISCHHLTGRAVAVVRNVSRAHKSWPCTNVTPHYHRTNKWHW